MKKIDNYIAELDTYYIRLVNRSKFFIVQQILLSVLWVAHLIALKNLSQYSIIYVPVGFWIYMFVNEKIRTIISMYLKDRNAAIYNKYKMDWSGIRGYYPLANVNLFKMTKSVLDEIADERIVRLIYYKRLSTVVLIISVFIQCLIIGLKAYKVF